MYEYLLLVIIVTGISLSNTIRNTGTSLWNTIRKTGISMWNTIRKTGISSSNIIRKTYISKSNTIRKTHNFLISVALLRQTLKINLWCPKINLWSIVSLYRQINLCWISLFQTEFGLKLRIRISDIFLGIVLLESSETYAADPSLNEIGAGLKFSSKHLVEKSLNTRNLKFKFS